MADEYFSVQWSFNSAGQHAACVVNYKIVNPTEPNDWILARDLCEQLLTGGATSMVGKLKAMMSDECFVSSLRARRFKPTGGNTFVQSFLDTTHVGAIASEVNAQQIAACTNWVPLSTEYDQARNFWPGIPENGLVGSRFTAPYQVLVDALITKFITGESVAGGIFLPCSFRRSDNTGNRIDYGYLSPKVGTQRRREVPI